MQFTGRYSQCPLHRSVAKRCPFMATTKAFVHDSFPRQQRVCAVCCGWRLINFRKDSRFPHFCESPVSLPVQDGSGALPFFVSLFNPHPANVTLILKQSHGLSTDASGEKITPSAGAGTLGNVVWSPPGFTYQWYFWVTKVKHHQTVWGLLTLLGAILLSGRLNLVLCARSWGHKYLTCTKTGNKQQRCSFYYRHLRWYYLKPRTTL